MLTLLVLLLRVVYLTRQNSLATNDAERCIRHQLCARAVALRHRRGKALPAKERGACARARSVRYSVAQQHPARRTARRAARTTAALSHHSYLKYIVLPVFNLLRAHCRDVTYLDRQSLHGSQPRVSHCVSKSGVVWALNLIVPW